MKKRTSKSKPIQKRVPARPAPQSTRPSVYIIGDRQIVEEVLPAFASADYSLHYRINSSSDRTVPSTHSSKGKQELVPENVTFALELSNLDLELKRRNLEFLDRSLNPSAVIISSSVAVSASEQSSWLGHKHRLVGCAALPWIIGRPLIEIAPTPFTTTGTVTAVQSFFRSIGKEIEIVQDRVGLVFPRLLCRVINETAYALQDEIAAPQDIDAAMKLGAEFPLGPIEWADRIGLDQVYAVLKALHTDLGQERYCMAPLLKQMALGGTWWHRTQVQTDERSEA